jgi:hypothetical protein
MRNNSISLKALVSLTLALLCLTNWTSILAQPFDSPAATDSASKTGHSYNVTRPVAATPAHAQGRAAEAYAKLPMSFEANRGKPIRG